MSVDIEHTEEEMAALKAKREAERQHCAEVADEISSGLNDDGYPRLEPDHLELLTKILVDQRSEAVIQGLFTIIDEFNTCKADRDAWKARAEASKKALDAGATLISALEDDNRTLRRNEEAKPTDGDSDYERRRAEAAAREVFLVVAHGGPPMPALQQGHLQRVVADLIMRERAGLLARAEAAESRVEDLKDEVARGVDEVTERLGALHRGIADDLRTKLAAAEEQLADWEASKVGVVAENAGLIARAQRAEAAAGQMRAALEGPLVGSAGWFRLRDAALATDVGRDYLSPEQVAHTCAAARDAALEEAAKAVFDVDCDADTGLIHWQLARDAVRALKVTP
jgi:hypothetical protein